MASGRFEGGWTAEIEIPFKSISFDPTADTWGLNFSRGIVIPVGEYKLEDGVRLDGRVEPYVPVLTSSQPSE